MSQIGIAIQVAARNWSGGTDFCVKTLDGIAIYKITRDRIKAIIDDMGLDLPIFYVAPARKEERDIFSMDTSITTGAAPIFFGSEYDVLDRLLDFGRLNGLDYIFRINGSFWYLNSPLCSKIFRHQAIHHADMIKLPADFPHGFAGELISVEALSRLREICRGRVITNPVAEMANNPMFTIYDVTPLNGAISSAEIHNIRNKRLQYEPERVEYDLATNYEEGSIDHTRYLKALSYINAGDVVLDIACGAGFGADMIARKAARVVGADYNEGVIRRCQLQYRRANLSYEVADVTRLDCADSSFDVVVSMETIEHVDEQLFVSNVTRVLKMGGKLILSTPQNRYGFCLTPWHIKEYSVDQLRDLLNPNFKVHKVHGITSALISDNSEGGDRMLVVAIRRSR
ncbi:MAG: hypothetical protein A3H35_11890 [Betaproteobacteria bacterium RIFCSPLOWO2_02_FULL_62_17]|nr:MAG: hypothetical protein A3H35_11890 [Betaproteobacteria bacterium RIFCSPLOWO2_02_FULL_62_17]